MSETSFAGIGPTRLPSQLQSDMDAINITVGTDGGVTIEEPMDEPEEEAGPSWLRHGFEENLSEHLLDLELRALSNDIQRGIDADMQDRTDWVSTAARAVEFLGLEVISAAGQDSSSDTSLSKVVDPLMMEATIRFWANAVPEFLPATGPAKVRDDTPPPVAAAPDQPGMGHNGGPPMPVMSDPPGPPTVPRAELAQAFEQDFNHYLTVTDRAYYRDFNRMLFSLGATGTQFRKVYYDPLRGRPVSQWVKAENLVVSSDAMDLSDAARVTQLMKYSQNNARRLQKAGWWRQCNLMTPMEETNEVERAIGDAEGVQRGSTLPEDHQHTIQECYLELDLAGFEHEDEEGNQTGIPLPYRVTIDKTSREILEIRRNWRQEDPLFQARQRFVMFGLIPGLKFYYLGFMHILGNGQLTLTSIRRMLLDAGMFSNFPGFLMSKGMGRQETTDIAPQPGEAAEIDTMNKPIGDVVMALPYKEPSAGLMTMAGEMRSTFMELAGVSQAMVGEGTADIPVGTIMAMIESTTKVMASVHKGLHASRAEELEMLRELIAEDPTVLTRYNKNPARQWEAAEEFQDLDLVPSSDPNVPSQMHRIMQAVALVQIAQGMPGVLDPKWVVENALRTINFEIPAEAFAKPAAGPAGPPQDPAKMLMAQAALQNAKTAAQDSQRKAAGEALQAENDRNDQATTAADRQADRESKERIQGAQMATEHMRMQAEQAQAQAEMARLHATDAAGHVQSAAELAQKHHQANQQHGLELAKHGLAKQQADTQAQQQAAQPQGGGGIAPPPKRIF